MANSKISIQELAQEIIFGESLEQKLISFEISQLSWDNFKTINPPLSPHRSPHYQITKKRLKFPRGSQLDHKEKRAYALHFFANHELLAIEMIAAALLFFPHHTAQEIQYKKGLCKILQDEQKHLKLYISRIKELGTCFGDLPMNDFFWKHFLKIKTPAQFSAMLSLTFEAANLDFSLYYRDLFTTLGDEKSAQIMDVIYHDEITHVAHGVRWLNTWRSEKNLWFYYLEQLIFPLTPARSKGIAYQEISRRHCGIDEGFLKELHRYQDDFAITKRKK